MVSLNFYNMIALICVLVIGIPHGGFDAAIARSRGWPQSFFYFITFHILYLLLALFVIIVWFFYPLLFLAIFLTLSGLHFGLSDIKHHQSMNLIPIIAHGGLIPIIIPYYNKVEVGTFFTILVGPHNSLTLLQWVDYLIIPWFFVMIIYAWKMISTKQYLYDYMSLLLLCFLALILPPIITFSIYFCLFHTPRHINLTLKEFSIIDKRRSIIEACIYSLVAILSMLYFYTYVLTDYTISERSLLIVFVGLAALTVPHMILVDYLFHQYNDDE